MGVPRAVQASPRPSMAWENCHITSGFSGLPKLRQLVAAMGRAPDAATLRAASATACMAPTLGLRKHQRPLPSVERARARRTPFFSDSLMRTTAASLAPGPARVLVRTLVSYCSVIQRLEAIAGEARSFFKKLLASPAIASKRWITEQYDTSVRTNTLAGPGASDAAVVRIKESEKNGPNGKTMRALALSTDGNGRWCQLNPKMGAMHAVAEAARNVATSGARPI